MAEGSFECQVSGRRESANGIFITLQVNPADLTADLAMLRVGSALMVGWSQVLDTAVHKIEAIPERSKAAVLENKPKTPFKDLRLSQQCGIRCGDSQFGMYLQDMKTAVARQHDSIADTVRQLCNVVSRSEFDKDQGAASNWLSLEEDYQAWLTTKRYQDNYR